jgi:hypothetical protein
MREKGLPSLNDLIEKFPKDATLLYERVKVWNLLGEKRNSISDLKRVIALMETEQSLPIVGIPFEHGQAGRSKSVQYFKNLLQLKVRVADEQEFLDSLTPTSSIEDKQRAVKILRNADSYSIEFKALEVASKLKLTEAVPVLLETLEGKDVSLSFLNLRAAAWKSLLSIRPEAKQVEYDPAAPEANRKAAIIRLRALFKIQ